MDTVQATIDAASISIQEHWTLVEAAREEVADKLADFRGESDKILRGLEVQFKAISNYISGEINRGIADNIKTRQLVIKTIRVMERR